MADMDATNENVLKEILEDLKCVACDQLPDHKIYLLGGPCTHKYCEKCVDSISGKPCVKCDKKKAGGAAHSPYVDLITTELLANVKQYRDCIESGNCCQPKKVSRGDSSEADDNNDGNKLLEKSKETIEDQVIVHKLKNFKPIKNLAHGKSRSSSSEQNKDSKTPESGRMSDRKSGRHSVTSENTKPEVVSSISTPKMESVQSDDSNLSRDRSRKSARRNSATTAHPSGPENADATPKRRDAIAKMLKTTHATVYDLDDEEILKEDEEVIPDITKFREKNNKLPLPLEKRRISHDEEKSPDSPPASLPDLTQHGNTPKCPKKPDLNIDDDAPALGAPHLTSPTLPILSPVTGKAVTATKDRFVEEKTPRRGSGSGFIAKADKLKLLRSTEHHARTESPQSNVGSRRTLRRTTSSSRSPSVGSNASTLDSSVTSASEKCNSKGETKLHVACRIGQVDKVQQLLNSAVDINACDFAGWTPLHEAINSKSPNSFEIVKLLCEAGCDVNTPGLDNETPLHECVRTGGIRAIKFLLSYGASTTLRNKAGKLPKEVTANETIQKILDEFKGPYLREPDQGEIIQAAMKNSLTFFAYDVDTNLLSTYELYAGVAKKFGPKVTHVIFDQKLVRDGKVPFSFHYLSSVLAGVWLLSSTWVEDSVKAGKFMDPQKYEITGCLRDSKSTVDQNLTVGVPGRARKNREIGHPGLFKGFNIYLYKNCGYEELKKKDLCSLITVGDGKVVNREANPESLNPLDFDTPFHTRDPGHKMTITSHVTLFDDTNKPTKLHSMEHMKTLRTDWLVECALHFTILNPDEFI